ncbi:MAG: metallophosphoesterase [Geminicoccaceae bacterium]
MTEKSVTPNVGTIDKDAAGSAEPPSLLGRIGRFLKMASGEPIDPIVPGDVPVRLTNPVLLSWQHDPFTIKLGDIALECHPDLSIDGDEPNGLREWVVHAGPRSDEAVPKFIRIAEGEAVVFGRCSELQADFFGYGRSIADRHVKISNRKGDLRIQPLDRDGSTTLSTSPSATSLAAARRERLMRLPAILGRALATFDDEEAFDKLREVNDAIAAEPYREQNEEGDPGGIIRFPDEMPVIIMGDVHARVDNVLRVLTENGVLPALERGELALVFLGDLVHSEATGELEDMTSSVLVFDLFCMLKLRFPKNVFYVHGNHESFSEDVGKGGVLQGLLFRKHLKKQRGKAYLKEMEVLFDQLAYVVHGKHFAACHGAPVRSKVDRQTLVNIRRYPGLQYELTWNRLRQGNRPAGYGKGSVKRFRQTLGLPKLAPMIVAHNPQSEDGTLWLNVGEIEGHHIVYSARTDRLAIMVISDGTSWPLELLTDPALAHLAP